ncbi:MAG: hypothetical protein NT080_11170 [Spirochaetes bacterium]|nr:hypothetical protein [Spirochaetota bacterium]
MTDGEAWKISKSLRQSKNYGWIMTALSLPFIAAIVVNSVRGDIVIVAVVSPITLLFIIMAVNGFIAAARCAADLLGKRTFADRRAVTGKNWISRKTSFSYYLQFGKSKYSVPKEIYDRIETGDEMDLRFTVRSGQLLSMKNSAGENYPMT